MTTTTTQRGLVTFITLLLALTMIPAALADTATDSQTLEVDVMQTGILSIDVADQVHFGELFPGQSTGPRTFDANYANTLETVAPWSATVTATNFVRHDWVHPDTEPEGSWVATEDEMSYTNLTIFPGYAEWAATDMGVTFEPATPFTGTENVSDPVTLFTAPDTFDGSFGTPGEDQNGDLAAYLDLFVPSDVLFGSPTEVHAKYFATLTYTLTG